MFDEFGQISRFQKTILDILLSPGISSGSLITIIVYSTATNTSVRLVVPDQVTVQAFLDALAAADKDAMLLPPTIIKGQPILLRSQTQQVLSSDAQLVRYHLGSEEKIDLYFSRDQARGQIAPDKIIRQSVSKFTQNSSGLPGWYLWIAGGVGFLFLLSVLIIGFAVLSDQLTDIPQETVRITPILSPVYETPATETPAPLVVLAPNSDVGDVEFAPPTYTAPPPHTALPHTATAKPVTTPTPCVDKSPYNLDTGQIAKTGCSTQDWVSNRNVVIQRFERGVMIIFAKPNDVFDNQGGGAIYVLVNDHRAWRVTDTFVETSSNPDDWYACERRAGQRPENSGIPWRGFGKVWCEYPEISAAIGNVRSAETLSSASFQSYENGRAFQVANWYGFAGWDHRYPYVVYLSSDSGSILSGEWMLHTD